MWRVCPSRLCTSTNSCAVQDTAVTGSLDEMLARVDAVSEDELPEKVTELTQRYRQGRVGDGGPSAVHYWIAQDSSVRRSAGSMSGRGSVT